MSIYLRVEALDHPRDRLSRMEVAFLRCGDPRSWRFRGLDAEHDEASLMMPFAPSYNVFEFAAPGGSVME